MRSKVFNALLVSLVVLAATLFSFSQAAQLQPDELANAPANARPQFGHVGPRVHANAGTNNGPTGRAAAITGIDSLVNFTGEYHTFGYDPEGNPQNTWYFDMVGNAPQKGGTTIINAPVVPVVVRLLDWDGSTRVVDHIEMISDPTKFVTPTLNSPVFGTHKYTSSPVNTQITDAVQRAEFYNVMKSDWHTLLNPSVKRKRTISVPRGTYFFQRNADKTCCAFILIDVSTFVNLLFPTVPTDRITPVGAAENAGDITTKDLSSFLFPNTFLFVGNTNNCCILGFHTYDFEPGEARNGNQEKRYVLDYSSWISPGLFGTAFQDVTALSHEIAETYDDPFIASDKVHGITPWWLAPNGNCQDDMETGDVIEGLPRATYPVFMNGKTYHPQNEALLQWFEFKSPSTALGGAYSYPNKETLTALSPIENVDCQ
jgi:hypothetical protein